MYLNKWITCLCFVWLLAGMEIARAQLRTPPNTGDEILVCGGSQVLIFRHTNDADSMPSIIWQWDALKVTHPPEGFMDTCFQKTDECKMSQDGKRILITASTGGGAAIIERSTHKILFWAPVPNAHSIEELPGGVVAVAASVKMNGNCIMLFDVRDPQACLYKDSLYSAHGLLWDQSSGTLYALGHSELRAYRPVNHLQRVSGLRLQKTWIIPDTGGHDLRRGPGANTLIITNEKGVYLFDTRKENFTPYTFAANGPDIKSISFHPLTGQLLYTQASESWWTHTVHLKYPDKVYVFPDVPVYKARWGK